MRIFEFINVIVETAIILFYCGNIFETNPSVNTAAKSIVILSVTALMAFTGIQHLGTIINLAVSFFACFFISFFIYEGALKTKLFISAVYVVMIIFADIIATVIITLCGIEYHMSGSDNVTYITGAMLSDFIRLWLLAYAGKILSRKIHDLPLSYWIFLFMCPVLSVVCLVIFDIYLMQAETINTMLVLIPPLCILYINFMLFRFFENFSEQIRLKVIEKLAKSEKENYKILQNNETELRKLRHDMNNHIMMIREYIARSNTQTALQHLENIQDALNELSAVVCTNNPAIDAAINIGARKAQSENIEYKAQIIGDTPVNIEAGDICKFLSNAVDNAIEGCSGCDAPYVYIELNISEENISIHIENPTVNKAGTLDFITTKHDKGNHGYGMKNMKSVVKKYNGMMNSTVIDGTFYLDAVLHNGL